MANPWKNFTVRDTDFVADVDRNGIAAHERRLGTLTGKSREAPPSCS